MRTAVTVISIATLVGCVVEPSQQQMLTAASLTLKMEETQVDGEPAAVLMLCENGKCFNPLRNKSGGDYHFKNHADLYNQKAREAGKGQKIKMALLGITTIATAAGGFIYIKSDAMRRIVTEAAEKIKKLDDEIAAATKKLNNKKRKNISADTDDIRAKLAKLGKEKGEQEATKKRLEKRDSWVTPTYWAALGISGLGTSALAFAPDIGEDNLWQDNKDALADLFIHGSAVKVTKDELIDLFAILVKQVPATIDVAVQSYLFSI